MTFSRRPGVRFNRGRIATGAAAAAVPATPLTIITSTTVTGWHRSDNVVNSGGFADRLTDLSNNGNHFEITLTERPAYAATGNFLPAYPAVTGDGSNDIMCCAGLASTFSGTDKGFYFAMVGGVLSATATRVLLSVGSTASANPRMDLLTNITAPGWQLTKTVDGTVSAGNESITGSLLGAGLHLFEVSAAGSSVSFYIDRVLVATTTLMDVGNLAVNMVSLFGRRRTTKDLWSQLEWYETIFANNAITAGERQDLYDDYLFPRYQIAKRFALVNGSTNGGYANGTVNTVPYRQAPIVSDSTGLQALPYYTNTGSSGKKTLAILKRASADATSCTLDISAQECDGGDAHNVVAAGMDGSNRLHIFADMHSQPMKHWNGSASGDINLGSFDATPIASGGAETQVTYPFTFGPDSSGNMYCLWRDGASSDGNMVLYRWNNASNAFEVRVSNLISGNSERSAYMAPPYFDRNTQRIYLAWTFREDINDFQTIHDLFYTYSDDYGVTWKRSDGTAQTVPITQANAEKAVTVAQNSGMVNTNVVVADANGSPVIFYCKDDGTGKTQMYCAYLSAGTWTTQQVSSWAVSFSLVGVAVPTESSFRFAFGFGVQRNGRIYVTFRYRDLHQGVLCFKGTPGGTWTQHTLDARNVEDGGNARYDEQLWWSSGRLQMYHQRVTTTATIGAQEIAVLEPTLP